MYRCCGGTEIASGSRALAGVVIAFVAIGGARVQERSTFYVLDQESASLEGCIVGLCLCPVALLDDLTGSFQLVELPTLQPDPWRIFEVKDVRWSLGRGDQIVEIRGSGLYQTAAPVLDEQRLTLDLTIDGDPIEPLDSGVVAGGLSFPSIDIQALTPGAVLPGGGLAKRGTASPPPTRPHPTNALIRESFLEIGLIARPTDRALHCPVGP